MLFLQLEESGFINSCMKFNQVKKDRRYRVIDNFTYFYNKLLKNNKTKNWVDIINEPYFLQWKESSFKNICLQNIDRIRKLLGINGIDTTVYYWTDHLDNNIIDIILLHDITKYIDIIECKYNDSIFEIDKNIITLF